MAATQAAGQAALVGVAAAARDLGDPELGAGEQLGRAREAQLGDALLHRRPEDGAEQVMEMSRAQLDPRGHVQTWNAGAQRLKGYSADEIVGRSILTLIPPDRHGEEGLILSKIRSGERVEHFETVRVDKQGRQPRA